MSVDIRLKTKVGLTVSIAAVILVWPTAHADNADARQAMLADCQAKAQSGDADFFAARECLIFCRGPLPANDPAAAADAQARCESAHAEVTLGIKPNHAPRVEEQPQGQRRPRTRSTAAATLPETKPMADIEGIYLQGRRSGYRVRAEGRDDWLKYCNEAARLETGSDEFSRAVKPYDRVRFVGITYDPALAGKPSTRCMAKRAIILGPGSP